MSLLYIITTAKINQPFLVFEMAQEDFKDFDIITKSTKRTNYEITQNILYKLTADYPLTLYARETHNTFLDHRHVIEFFQNSVCIDFNTLSHLYSIPLPIFK